MAKLYWFLLTNFKMQLMSTQISSKLNTESNKQIRNYDLPDPPLTPLGFGPQSEELKVALQGLPLAQEIDLIVISPMRRTLQTAQQGLGWLMDKGVPVILRAEWQENSAKPCDTGSSIADMSKEWPQFAWDTVDPIYPSKADGTLYEFSKDGLARRGVEARKWLKSRPEKVVAVVSHSGFLRIGVSYRKYENADFRIFDFGEGHDDVGGILVERELTEKNGGGLGKSIKGVFGWEEMDTVKDYQTVNATIENP